jgi:hypothetical protein
VVNVNRLPYVPLVIRERGSSSYRNHHIVPNSWIHIIASAGREIDHLVYELYDLTDEDISIVEGQVG